MTFCVRRTGAEKRRQAAARIIRKRSEEKNIREVEAAIREWEAAPEVEGTGSGFLKGIWEPSEARSGVARMLREGLCRDGWEGIERLKSESENWRESSGPREGTMRDVRGDYLRLGSTFKLNAHGLEACVKSGRELMELKERRREGERDFPGETRDFALESLENNSGSCSGRAVEFGIPYRLVPGPRVAEGKGKRNSSAVAALTSQVVMLTSPSLGRRGSVLADEPFHILGLEGEVSQFVEDQLQLSLQHGFHRQPSRVVAFDIKESAMAATLLTDSQPPPQFDSLVSAKSNGSAPDATASVTGSGTTGLESTETKKSCATTGTTVTGGTSSEVARIVPDGDDSTVASEHASPDESENVPALPFVHHLFRGWTTSGRANLLPPRLGGDSKKFRIGLIGYEKGSRVQNPVDSRPVKTVFHAVITTPLSSTTREQKTKGEVETRGEQPSFDFSILTHNVQLMPEQLLKTTQLKLLLEATAPAAEERAKHIVSSLCEAEWRRLAPGEESSWSQPHHDVIVFTESWCDVTHARYLRPALREHGFLYETVPSECKGPNRRRLKLTNSGVRIVSRHEILESRLISYECPLGKGFLDERIAGKGATYAKLKIAAAGEEGKHAYVHLFATHLHAEQGCCLVATNADTSLVEESVSEDESTGTTPGEPLKTRTPPQEDSSAKPAKESSWSSYLCRPFTRCFGRTRGSSSSPSTRSKKSCWARSCLFPSSRERRLAQVQTLSRFIKEQGIPLEEPVFLVGDFNTDMRGKNGEYQEILRALGPRGAVNYHPECPVGNRSGQSPQSQNNTVSSGNSNLNFNTVGRGMYSEKVLREEAALGRAIGTYDSCNDWIDDESGYSEFLDHVFLLRGWRQPRGAEIGLHLVRAQEKLEWKDKRAWKRCGRPMEFRDLSDHYPVWARMKF